MAEPSFWDKIKRLDSDAGDLSKEAFLKALEGGGDMVEGAMDSMTGPMSPETQRGILEGMSYVPGLIPGARGLSNLFPGENSGEFDDIQDKTGMLIGQGYDAAKQGIQACLLYTSPSPRDS